MAPHSSTLVIKFLIVPSPTIALMRRSQKSVVILLLDGNQNQMLVFGPYHKEEIL